MPKRLRIPSYCRHKATGQAVVRLGGKDFYLGKYGTAESRQRHRELTFRWQGQTAFAFVEEEEAADAPEDAAD